MRLSSHWIVAVCLIGSAFGAEAPVPPAADKHTIGLLRFDQEQGTVVKDASGHGHQARLEKTPNEPRWYKYGRFGGCLAFDGRNPDENGDKKGDADGLVWQKGATPDPKGAGFTAEMWVRHAHLHGQQLYLARHGGAGRYTFGTLQGAPYAHFRPANGDWVRARAPRPLRVDVWHHVAFTCDRKFVRIFVDGVEKVKAAMSGHIAAGPKLTIVGHDTDPRPSQIRGFCGLMDEVRISNTARTKFPKGPHKTKDPMPAYIRKAVKESARFLEPDPVVRDVTVTGMVFEDRNGNGKRDPGEQGIAGVWVTEGEHINPSDQRGTYEFKFKIDEHRLVYITLPAGRKATGPWYHLIEQDDKETDYKFDFALQRDPTSLDRNFAFLVGADSQFSSQRAGEMLKADMAQITRATGRPRFFFNCGDLTQTGWLQEWRWYKAAMRALTIPGYDVFGGHGGNYLYRTAHKRRSVHHYNLFCGPTYHSWNYGGRHFAVYNCLHGYMSKAARKRQENWMKADLGMLKPGSEVVLIAHYPVAVERWRRDLKQVACFYGHWHENQLHYYKGVPNLCTNALRGRDWGAFTRTVRFCEFKDGKLTTELRPTGQYKRVEIIHPQAGGALPQGRVPLRVIAFDTASRATQVAARIGRTEIKLKKLGQFTWGEDLDTTRMTPGAYELTVAVKDDRPESWPRKKCPFRIARRALARGTVGEDWPMVFKSLRELRTARHAVKPPLDLAWSRATGGQNQRATSPIVYRGNVYIGVENANVGHNEHAVLCYEAATGKRVWRTPVDSCIRFSLAADNGRIFAQTNSGVGYAFDAHTGRVVWKKRVFSEKTWPMASKSSVLVYRGKVIMYGDYDPIVLFDARSGEILARCKLGGRRMYAGPFPDGDRLWVHNLYWAFACDMMTGKPLWKVTGKGVGRRGCSIGVVHDGVYYVRGYSCVAAYNRADGELLWRVNNRVLSAGALIPTIAGGVLYAGGQDTFAVDLKTRKTLWTYSAMRKPGENNQRQTFGGQSSPLVSGNLLYVGRDDGDLAALDRRSGKLVWRFNVGVPIKSSPVVSGNMLFVSDYDGNLYAFASASK